MCRRQADEVLLLETAIRQRGEQQRKAGAELDATCQLCLKTKFADGLGHACHYCNVRCCARCGGKVALRSAKVTARLFICVRLAPLTAPLTVALSLINECITFSLTIPTLTVTGFVISPLCNRLLNSNNFSTICIRFVL